MYYLDSNALIYPALYEGPKATRAAGLLRAVVEGEEEAATASLTLDEVVWITARETSRDAGIEQGERLLKLPNLRILDVRSRDILRALKHMREYEGLTPRDAVHLATMTEHGIHSIVSDDDDFDDVGEATRVPLEEIEI